MEKEVIMGYQRRACILLFIACLIIWKLCRTDWIVECEYVSTDFHPTTSIERGTATYKPPVSAIWNPPSPSALVGRANANWNDPEFFAAGGSYGPVGTPMLRINWLLMFAKLIGGMGLLWLLFRISCQAHS